MVLKRQKVLFYNVSNFKCFVSVIYHLFKNSFLTPLCFFPRPLRFILSQLAGVARYPELHNS